MERNESSAVFIILTCLLSPCGRFTFPFTVHNNNTDAVFCVGQQVCEETVRYTYRLKLGV